MPAQRGLNYKTISQHFSPRLVFMAESFEWHFLENSFSVPVLCCCFCSSGGWISSSHRKKKKERKKDVVHFWLLAAPSSHSCSEKQALIEILITLSGDALPAKCFSQEGSPHATWRCNFSVPSKGPEILPGYANNFRAVLRVLRCRLDVV